MKNISQTLCGGFIDKPICATKAELQSVIRGIYVMQSVEEEKLFRFGKIGGGSSNNNAFERLGQCSNTWRLCDEIGGAGARGKWRFVLLCHVAEASTSQIKCLEDNLRKGLMAQYERYSSSLPLLVKRYRDKVKDEPRRLAKPRDAFVAENAAEVEQVARKLVAAHLASKA